MSKGNKSAREQLERLYGKECFVEKLHLRKDDKPHTYKGKAQLKRTKQLTYHHIQERSQGGKATAENGAILSAENHIWFNQQPKEEQRRMNEAFQEYKRSFRVNGIGLVVKDKGIEMAKLEVTDPIKLAPELEAGVIELEPMTEEEQAKYEEYKAERRKRTFKKFGADPVRKKAQIDEEWQKEIIEDLEMEFNERNRGGYGR